MAESNRVNPDHHQALYVIREGALGLSNDDPDFLDVLLGIWQGRWLVFSATLTFSVLSVIFVFVQTEWFRSEVTIVPTEARSTASFGGQLGSLAALAGVRVGGESAEAMATLKSRDLARALIEEHGLLTVFFEEDWDSERGRWIDDNPENWPDIRDAVKYFHDDVLDISERPDAGVVTVAVNWKDPEAAAQWVTALVELVNDRLRERALQESELSIEYLRAEMEKTSIVPLQQSIGRLLEAELQKLMLARGSEEFAFRIVDPATVPKERHWPRRALVVVVGTTLGGLFGLFAAFLRHLWWRRRVR